MRRSPAALTAAAYLAARTRTGVKFGLETIRALVAELDHPEQAYTTLLVAGTNGKGSVVAYVDAALRASGLRVGRYTSPHLVRLNERILVDGREITDRELDAAVGRVRETAEALVRAGLIRGHPTHFEALTAAAFEHFRQAGVQVAVLEVGMGGRLDATNVCRPLASAIVSIDFDHETYLGTTLTEIATEKAGVLRSGVTTVLGPLPDEARAAVAARAAAIGARLVDTTDVRVRERDDGVDLRTKRRHYRGLRPLRGAHQRQNLQVAVRLLEEAREVGLAVDLSAIPAGVNRTSWPGRLEWVPGDPPLLLDGAHNPAGARALADHLRTLGPFVLLFGVMRDKAVDQIARTLFPLARCVVVTRPRVARAASPREVIDRAGAVAADARRESDSRRALALARSLAPRGRPVVVAGSLYLVGEVKAALGERRRLRAASGSRLGGVVPAYGVPAGTPTRPDRKARRPPRRAAR
jgi:dihydrofolate synthase/folylpolyglutamate synthase